MTEPVSLSLMRQHLGISQSTDTARDAIISARIVSARIMAEFITGSAITLSSCTAYARQFKKRILFLKAPLISVQSITYLDQSDQRQTIPISYYVVDTVNSSVEPKNGKSWPFALDQANSVQINYTAGYASAALVPQNLKDAIMYIVSTWEVFQNSMETVMRPSTIPFAAIQLLQPQKDYREYFGSSTGISTLAIAIGYGSSVPDGYEPLLDVNGDQIYDSSGDPLYVLSTSPTTPPDGFVALFDSAGQQIYDSSNQPIYILSA